MKKIMLVCLSLVAFAIVSDAQTRGAKTGKIEQAQSRATNATVPTTSTPTTAPSTSGRPAKESKESQEAADQKDRDGDQEQGAQGGDKMKNLLGLNDDQNAKFKAIVAEVRQAVKAIRKDEAVAKGDKMAKIKAIYDDRDSKLKNIFSADQFTKWLDLSKKKMGKGNRKSDN